MSGISLKKIQKAIVVHQPASIAHILEKFMRSKYGYLLSSENETLPGQSAAVTFSNPKTAALAFDRVWDPTEVFPTEIGFRMRTRAEIELLLLTYLNNFEDVEGVGLDAESDDLRLFLQQRICNCNAECDECPYPNVVHSYSRHWSDLLSYCMSSSPVPIYSGKDQYDYEFKKEFPEAQSSRKVIEIVLTGLRIVDEEALEWEQVIEFRKDKASRTKYLRLIKWLEEEGFNKPIERIRDQIELKLYEYENAIEKHAFPTIMAGALHDIYDDKWILSLTAGGGVAAAGFSGRPILSSIATAGLLLGKVGLSIYERTIKYRSEIKHSEIAYIYDIKKSLGEE
jgi:hypothetical protein